MVITTAFISMPSFIMGTFLLLLFGLCFMIIQPILIRFSTGFMEERDLYDSTIVLLPLSSLLEKLAQEALDRSAEFVTLFYGEDVTEEDAQKAEAIFAAACPNAEVSLLPGGQPVYYYMISAE